jgi:hypothetical protein
VAETLEHLRRVLRTQQVVAAQLVQEKEEETARAARCAAKGDRDGCAHHVRRAAALQLDYKIALGRLNNVEDLYRLLSRAATNQDVARVMHGASLTLQEALAQTPDAADVMERLRALGDAVHETSRELSDNTMGVVGVDVGVEEPLLQLPNIPATLPAPAPLRRALVAE